MTLEKLVPPLELCKLIPAGEFADSALAWFSNYHFGGFHVEKRGLAAALTDNGEIYPAPADCVKQNGNHDTQTDLRKADNTERDGKDE